jgi:hypothetical protein
MAAGVDPFPSTLAQARRVTLALFLCIRVMPRLDLRALCPSRLEPVVLVLLAPFLLPLATRLGKTRRVAAPKSLPALAALAEASN